MVFANIRFLFEDEEKELTIRSNNREKSFDIVVCRNIFIPANCVAFLQSNARIIECIPKTLTCRICKKPDEFLSNEGYDLFAKRMRWNDCIELTVVAYNDDVLLVKNTPIATLTNFLL